MKKKVKEYMTAFPQTIGIGAPLHLAKMIMDETACHHLPVLDGGHLKGMVSYADLNLFLMTSNAMRTRIDDVMTTEPYVVDPDEDVKVVASEMLKQKISSAIIKAKGDVPWGIFTTTDALKVIVDFV